MNRQIFTHAAGGVTFSRLPLYPQYGMVFDQALETTSEGRVIAFPPIAQELTIALAARIDRASKDGLEVFFRDIANGTTEVFTYANEVTGTNLPVRFADAELPRMAEVAYDQYQVSLSLRGATNFPQLGVPAGAPPALTGSRFVIGSCALSFASPLRSGSGYGLSKLQPASRDSAGDLVIYDRSSIVQYKHALEIRHNRDVFAGLQTFFFSYACGALNAFTWYDHEERARTVRLAGGRIVIKQLGYNLYQTSLNLLEEVPV